MSKDESGGSTRESLDENLDGLKLDPSMSATQLDEALIPRGTWRWIDLVLIGGMFITCFVAGGATYFAVAPTLELAEKEKMEYWITNRCAALHLASPTLDFEDCRLILAVSYDELKATQKQ